MSQITIDGTTYSDDFTIEEIAEKSGKGIKEIEAIILDQVKTEALQKVNLEAKAYQEKLAPAELVEEYRRKEAAAKAFAKDAASEADKAILQVEADALNIDVTDHAQAILLKVALFDQVWTQIVEFRTKTKLAIQAAKTQEAIEAILLAAKQQADQAFAQLEA